MKFIPAVSRRRISIGLGVLGLVFAVLFAMEYRRRQQLYWYDVGRDHEYRFDAAERLPVEVERDGFTVPEAPLGADTAFLRLTVDSGLTGGWFEPYVVVGTDTAIAARQYLERGASGVRYLNLGPARNLTPGTRVRLVGHHVDWPTQTAELLLFRNPPLDGRRILVVAPHPDDAEIAAFGAYAFRDSWILTLTAGNYVDGLYAHIDADGPAADRLRGEVRTWDSMAVPMWGGIPPSRSIQLGLPTGSLSPIHRGEAATAAGGDWGDEEIERARQGNLGPYLDGHPAPATWEELVTEISGILARIDPEIVIMPDPSLDAAADHGLAALALLRALDRSELEPFLLLYTNHLVHGEYYPFGPAGSTITLPPWFGETPLAPGVLSVPLDERRQLEKLFALEAMHDLRAAPIPVSADGPAGRFVGRVAEGLRDLRRDPFGTYSYYRRAVRPNELFFVYPPSRRAELQQRVERELAAR